MLSKWIVLNLMKQWHTSCVSRKYTLTYLVYTYLGCRTLYIRGAKIVRMIFLFILLGPYVARKVFVIHRQRNCISRFVFVQRKHSVFLFRTSLIFKDMFTCVCVYKSLHKHFGMLRNLFQCLWDTKNMINLLVYKANFCFKPGWNKIFSQILGFIIKILNIYWVTSYM